MAKKILMVIAPYKFSEKEYELCRRIWEMRGHKVSVASLERGMAIGEEEKSIPVDLALKDVKYYDYDAIVFLGGEGAEILFDDENARKLAKDAKYKVLCASDKAVMILALAEVIEGKRVTGPVEFASWITKGKGIYTGKPVQVDGKLVTSADRSMTEQFANAVVEAVEKD
jgi:protease I